MMDDFIDEPPFIESGSIKVRLKYAGPLEPLPDIDTEQCAYCHKRIDNLVLFEGYGFCEPLCSEECATIVRRKLKRRQKRH